MIDKATEAQILRLYEAEKWPVGTIATQLQLHHDTVERVIGCAGVIVPPVRHRASMADPYLDFITETLEKYPSLCSSRLFEMAKERGYAGGPDHFRHVVSRMRPRRRVEAFLRLRTLIGEQAQADWGAFGKLPVGKAQRPLWAFVMVLSWSRQIFVRFYLSAAMPSFVRGHVDAFEFFQGCPRTILYDNLKSAVIERVGTAIRFNDRLTELSRHYHFEPRPVAVARGNEKGRVGRAIRYIRDSFFAARKFADVDDLNAQAAHWMTGIAADRLLPDDRTKRVREAFVEEQQRLIALPDEPFSSDEVVSVEVGKTPHVRFDLNDYSVPHSHVRRTLIVAASLQTVRVLDGTETIATHPRCWDRDRRIDNPEHTLALVEQKRQAKQHRGTDRLIAAAPSAPTLIRLAAEQGGNPGSIVARLLVLLNQVGSAELEAAIADAVARERPTVGAVRQVLDRRLAERGLPPPVPIRISTNDRAASVTVRNHNLSTYDQLNRTTDGTEEE